MRHAFLASVLLLIGALPARATTCEEYQIDLRDRGILVKFKVHALSLLDASVSVERELQMSIRVNVPHQPCQNEYFAISSDLSIILPGRTLLATLTNFTAFKTSPKPGFYGQSLVDVHKTVTAAILKEMEFDGFEPQNGQAFQRLFDLEGDLPLRRDENVSLGAALLGGVRYQVYVTEVRARLPN